jgi:outer membrane protein assembly factor BamA
MRIKTLILTVLLGFAATSTASAEKIGQIVVVENAKTTDDTVLFIANIEKGDDWSEDVKAAVIVELVSSGLFKSIDVFSEQLPKGGTKVTIVAKDKHSWVIAPTFYNQPTNKGGGLGFGENNLFGQNKKLLLYGQVATGDSFFVAAYIDPSIGGSAFHWAFDLFLQNQRVLEYAIPSKFLDAPEAVRQTKLRYLNAGGKLGVTLFRSLTLSVRSRRGKRRFCRQGPRATTSPPKSRSSSTGEPTGTASPPATSIRLPTSKRCRHWALTLTTRK